jgi:hypothetical protein
MAELSKSQQWFDEFAMILNRRFWIIFTYPSVRGASHQEYV